MTLIIAHRLADRIELLSDGAVYDKDGVIHAAECKIDRIEGFTAVIAGSGKSYMIDLLSDAIRHIFARASTFDAATDAVGYGVQTMAHLADHPPFRMLIAGISQTQGPKLYRFGNILEEGIAPFILHPVEYGTALQHNFTSQWHDETVSMGGLRTAGLRGMKNIRNDGPIGNNPPYGMLVVGCHVDFTTVSAGGVVTERIHEWPDRIGEKIVLAKDPPVTRQQRRALERQQRKASA